MNFIVLKFFSINFLCMLNYLKLNFILVLKNIHIVQNKMLLFKRQLNMFRIKMIVKMMTVGHHGASASMLSNQEFTDVHFTGF